MRLAFDTMPCRQEIVHAGNEFVELKELGLPDRVLAMGWCGDSICLGFHRECAPHTSQPQSFNLCSSKFSASCDNARGARHCRHPVQCAAALTVTIVRLQS